MPVGSHYIAHRVALGIAVGNRDSGIGYRVKGFAGRQSGLPGLSGLSGLSGIFYGDGLKRLSGNGSSFLSELPMHASRSSESLREDQ